MKSTIVATAIFAALGETAAAPAHAADQADRSQRAPRIQFAYQEPVVSEQTITWRWKLVNIGDADAESVIVVHRMTPQLAVQTLDPVCQAGPRRVRCHYRTVPAGRQLTGRLVARLPENASGNVEIHGQVTWYSVGAGRTAARKAMPARTR
jgi:hypothetical protein